MRVLQLSIILGLLAGSAACTPALVTFDDYPDADRDDDGLLDREEAELGTDPESADTDGDGHTDGEEAAQGTDPLDSAEHPYLGGYPIDTACRDQISGTGTSVGDIAQNFSLTDQYGDTVKLHDFCDHTVVLLSSAVWCGPCNSEAPVMGALYDKYAADGLMVITLLGENFAEQTPSVEELAAWADEFGLSHPVVADASWSVSGSYTGGSISLPTMNVIAPGGEVTATDVRLGEAEIRSALGL